MGFLLSGVDSLGRLLLGNLNYTFKVIMMIYLSCRAAIVDQAQGLRTVFTVVSAQIFFTGVQAIPIISVLAVVSGSVVILQASGNLGLIGGSEMIGNLLVAILVRELGPLITALIVIARSGTAVASELGNMRANREIDALESMGINPLSFIVFPRLLGGVISVVCLAFYFNLIALMGGFFVTMLLHNMPLGFYLDSILQALSSEDLFLFFLKNVFSGSMIFVISCYQGLSVKKSSTEVPVATTQAVVKSIIYVVFFNFAVTVLFYFDRLIKMGVL